MRKLIAPTQKSVKRAEEKERQKTEITRILALILAFVSAFVFFVKLLFL
jgi:preprotein translocase subunit SecY